MLILGSTAALVGCDSTGPSGAGPGQLTVKLTDAPGDLLEAHVTIERVAIVSTEDSSTSKAAESSPQVLSDSATTVDLIQLQDGVTETLGQIEIPEGQYSQLRLITARDATVYYEDANDERQEAALMLPSADQTGIKISFPAFTIDDANDTVEITLDFDVQDSFVQAGQTGTYRFKPVVKAQSVVVNNDTTTTSGS